MFVPLMAFYAKVSDPVIGGTYMTLLNTISNLGMSVYVAVLCLTHLLMSLVVSRGANIFRLLPVLN